MENFERNVTEHEFDEAVSEAEELLENMDLLDLTSDQVDLIKSELPELSKDNLNDSKKPFRDWLIFFACERAVLKNPNRFNLYDVRNAFSIICSSVPGGCWDKLHESWSSSIS